MLKSLSHLLTHSSGLGYDGFDPTLVEWAKAAGRTVDTNSYSLEGYTVPLVFEPGEGWVYGVSLDWVGHLVSVLTNTTFEDYLYKHIFTPLGMSSTTFRLAQRPDLVKARAAIGLRATPTAPLTAGGSDPVPTEPEMAGGGSGLFSTAADYAKLLGALIAGGGGILQPETVREMCQPQLPDNKYLMMNFENPYLHDVFCCEYSAGTPANYALGGAVNLEDLPEKRRKGSIMWSGMSNPHWVSFDKGFPEVKRLIIRRSGWISRVVLLRCYSHRCCHLVIPWSRICMMSWRKLSIRIYSIECETLVLRSFP